MSYHATVQIQSTPETEELPIVSAVIPCLNEERTLGSCITKAQAALLEMGIAGEVVVADNGSTDRSVDIATMLGAVVVHEVMPGYGAALQAGIRAARGRIIVMADADDSYDWASLGEYVRKIQEGYDLVMGNRFKGKILPGAMPWMHRYIGNPVLSLLSRVAFRVPIGDFHCGMRAFTRSAFERMRPRTSGMEFATEMIANAAYQRLKVCEIPTTLSPDKRGRPPHLRSFRDGWRHLRFIMTYAPDYLYFAPGLAMFLVGVGLLGLLAGGPASIGGVSLGIHFVALGAMLSLIGFNVLNLGVMAKNMLARRYAGMHSRTVAWVSKRFSLELGLCIGVALFLAGLGVDAWILAKWWAANQGPMEETVHLAFVASTAAVIGLNTVFNSFLLAMIKVPEDRG